MTADEEFRFRSGRLSLDFAATLGGRHRGGIERLVTPDDLQRWLGLAIPGNEQPTVSESNVRQARDLREAVYRLVHPSTRDTPRPADVELLNRCASRSDFAPQLGSDARSLVLRAGRAFDAGMATVARDAIDLLTGPLLPRVSECARPDCSLLFVDVSRPGRRRWCDMASCGNVAKAQRFRSRARVTQDAGSRPARPRPAAPAP